MNHCPIKDLSSIHHYDPHPSHTSQPLKTARPLLSNCALEWSIRKQCGGGACRPSPCAPLNLISLGCAGQLLADVPAGPKTFIQMELRAGSRPAPPAPAHLSLILSSST